MVNVSSHIHPLPTGDSCLSQAMLVTEAKITPLVSIPMLWVTLVSLKRFLSTGVSPSNQKDSWVPSLEPAHCPAPRGGGAGVTA